MEMAVASFQQVPKGAQMLAKVYDSAQQALERQDNAMATNQIYPEGRQASRMGQLWMYYP
jgi:hypothetical protein